MYGNRHFCEMYIAAIRLQLEVAQDDEGNCPDIPPLGLDSKQGLVAYEEEVLLIFTQGCLVNWKTSNESWIRGNNICAK